ncbi:MAG: hypothetical protein QF450_02130 [Rhodospirillales bacterium]|jgi:hypothetical protein|nr:hypothetical protein [Rhodospirillales bacterium]HJO72055.1 hypothetical protein [Rhodospirillales bacterium]
MSPPANADAWGLPRVLEFFETRWAVTTGVYPSEWHFLEGRLHEGVSVLEYGCEHPVTDAAVTPARQVTTRVYCVER